MKVSIQTYRGFEIKFDTEEAIFECEVKDKGKESKSFDAIKNFIDEYLKDNATFEPFYVVKASSIYSSIERFKIIGIRKDGRFITENEKGEKRQISAYYEKDYLIEKPEFNALFAEMAVVQLEVDAAKEKLKKVENKITLDTLKSVKSNYLQQS